jgi:hypothetical protein
MGKQEDAALRARVEKIADNEYPPQIQQAYVGMLTMLAKYLGFDNSPAYVERDVTNSLKVKPAALRSSFQKDLFEVDYWGDGETLYIIEVSRDPAADPMTNCWTVEVWADGHPRIRLPKDKKHLEGVEAFTYAPMLQDSILPQLIEAAQARMKR